MLQHRGGYQTQLMPPIGATCPEKELEREERHFGHSVGGLQGMSRHKQADGLALTRVRPHTDACTDARKDTHAHSHARGRSVVMLTWRFAREDGGVMGGENLPPIMQLKVDWAMESASLPQRTKKSSTLQRGQNLQA